MADRHASRAYPNKNLLKFVLSVPATTDEPSSSSGHYSGIYRGPTVQPDHISR